MFKWLKGAGRVMEHADGLQAAYVPDADVVVDQPAPFVVATLDAALAGDFEQVATVFEQTRQRAAWLDRSHLVSRTVDLLQRRPEILDAWAAHSPDNTDLATLRADLAVMQAWQVRTAARASKVSRRRFEAFHDMLTDAVPLIRTAMELAPEDPEAVRVALAHSIGHEAPRHLFDRYVQWLWEIDPVHCAGNLVAQQYLGPKWFGSVEEIYDFTRQVLDRAPEDAEVQMLLLTAVLEHLIEDGQEAVSPSLLDEAVQRARGFVDAHPDAPPYVTAAARNHIAGVLWFAGRDAQAYDELVSIGPHATEFPWVYFGRDARKAFLDAREVAATRKALTM